MKSGIEKKSIEIYNKFINQLISSKYGNTVIEVI